MEAVFAALSRLFGPRRRKYDPGIRKKRPCFVAMGGSATAH